MVREDKFSLEMLGLRRWWNKQAKVSSRELQVDEGSHQRFQSRYSLVSQVSPEERVGPR